MAFDNKLPLNTRGDAERTPEAAATIARVEHAPTSGGELLSKTHLILERHSMQFRPFGKDVDGTIIRDMTGVSIRSNVEFLEEYVARDRGAEAGKQAVNELVRRLNERIPDRAYHVTVQCLKNPWTSYSNEFTAFLVELCVDISGDRDFQFNMGREKLIPPLMQTLMRPFSVKSIYRGATRWIQHYAKNSYDLQGIVVEDGYALMRMTLMDRAVEQFGPYRRACARIWCNALKVGVSIVPEKVHGLRPAVMIDKRCLVEGDECCEWEVRWQEPDRWYPGRKVAISLARSILKEEISRHENVIEEQTDSLKSRHKELERAHVELQNTAVELQKRVDYLTTLHESGLTFTSTRDRDSLIHQALEVLMHKLSYDRVMISFYDPLRQVAHSARLVGVPQAIAASAQEMEVPVVDPSTVEGRVLLLGQPVLVTDISQVREQLHPYYRNLAAQTGTESFLSVPLKVKNWVLGSLTVDSRLAHGLTQEDLELMMTFANQLAIALDNAAAYREIELLNAGLEEKIRERTVQLEGANRQLTELNQLKSAFVSIVSHELRTPMTSMRIYVSNMLDGVIGAVTDRQKQYLSRIEFNIDRLTRMIVDLLDLSSIEAGKVGLRLQAITVNELVEEVTENIRSLAADKSITLECAVSYPEPLEADRDKLTQILTNLLANGIKYSPPGGIVRVSTELLPEAGSIRFCIADTGCGIQPEELPKVFETFFRGSANTAETRGAGLGLAIVKSLVELHGGRVWVESTVGRGSSFYFTLPLTPAGESR